MDKIYETMPRNQAKLDRTGKLLNLFLRNFWPLVPTLYLRKEDLVLGSVAYHFCDIPNISLFPKVLSLKLFGNSYTVFLVLDIKNHFTLGEWNLY